MMRVHFNNLEVLLFFKNILKKPPQTLAFFLGLIYNCHDIHIFRLQRFSGLGKCIFWMNPDLLEISQKLFKKKSSLRVFLRMNSGILGFLNTVLPFQHRNKMGFLCVT